jgi:arylsulfatase A-like enzyme
LVADGATVPKEIRRGHYRALVHALDDSVATVLAALESAGRGDAIVLFTAALAGRELLDAIGINLGA